MKLTTYLNEFGEWSDNWSYDGLTIEEYQNTTGNKVVQLSENIYTSVSGIEDNFNSLIFKTV